jgi:hypothetical protein
MTLKEAILSSACKLQPNIISKRIKRSNSHLSCMLEIRNNHNSPVPSLKSISIPSLKKFNFLRLKLMNLFDFKK